jgi:hypothetical protein
VRADGFFHLLLPFPCCKICLLSSQEKNTTKKEQRGREEEMNKKTYFESLKMRPEIFFDCVKSYQMLNNNNNSTSAKKIEQKSGSSTQK